MTDHVARLYTLVIGVLVFFVAWAAVVAHPWATTPTAQSSAVAALVARQQLVQRQSLQVQKLLQSRGSSTALPPKVVTLPPLTVTKVS